MDRTACTEPQYLYKGALYLTLLYLSSRFIVYCSSNVAFNYWISRKWPQDGDTRLQEVAVLGRYGLHAVVLNG